MNNEVKPDESKLEEVKQPDELWAQANADRASTPAAEDADTADANAETTEADPLAGLPEPTRKLIEGLQAKTVEQDTALRETKQQLATAHGRYGSLKQQLDASQVQIAKIAPAVEAVETQRKAAEKSEADTKAKRREELRAKMKEDFPDIAAYIDELVPADVKPADQAKPGDVKPAGDKPADKVAVQDQPHQRQESAEYKPDVKTVAILQRGLDLVVPGWMQKRETPEFKAWLPKQTAEVKAAAGSWDVAEAASVFKAFDKHKSDAAQVAKIEQERQERLRRGETVQGRGSSTGDVDTSPDALWNQAKREREKARTA